jgi:two-component system, chemotaxis family, chemotaxis protein CheY
MKRIWEGQKILVVDDSAKVRQMLADRYSRLGFDVVGSATNCLDAIEKVKDLRPDVLSLEIILPEMDGIECYRTLSKTMPGLKFVFVTVLASEPRIVDCYAEEIGQARFIPKSLSDAEFARRIELAFDPSNILPPVPEKLPSVGPKVI